MAHLKLSGKPGKASSQSQFGISSVALSLVVLACSNEPPEEPPPSVPPAPTDEVAFAAPHSEPGHLMRMEGRLAFLHCGEGPTAIWLAESVAAGPAAAQAWAELGGGNRPVPALVRIAGDTILEVRHAAPEGGPCTSLPGEGLVNARGNEPFWHLRVGADSATVSTPELLDGVRYPGTGWERPDSTTWRYRTVGDSITLQLRERRCQDGMSAAWFPFEAEVRWREQELRGCALEGADARHDG